MAVESVHVSVVAKVSGQPVTCGKERVLVKLLNKIVYYGSKVLTFIGNIVLITILVVILAGIISRYVFGKPFSWTEELSTFLQEYLGVISGAIVSISNKHIVADVLISKAPPKMRKIVGVFSQVLAIVVFLFICISSYPMLERSLYKTPALGLPRHLFYVPVFYLSVFMVFVIVVDILNAIFPGYALQEGNEERE